MTLYLDSALFLFSAPSPTDVSTLPYTTLFRSDRVALEWIVDRDRNRAVFLDDAGRRRRESPERDVDAEGALREKVAGDPEIEEHTSELQSRGHLVCRLLLEKKKKQHQTHYNDL